MGFSATPADVTQIPAQEIKYYINKKIEPTIRGNCKTTQIEKMVHIKTFKQIALSFNGTEEKPHFDRTAFKVVERRIFATLHEKSKTANIIFSKTDQSVYCSFDENAVYPVANKWGLQGWTTFQLARIDSQLMLDALDTAYNEVLKSKKK